MKNNIDLTEGNYLQLSCGKCKSNGVQRNCALCLSVFHNKVARAIYCSKRCKVKAWQLANPKRMAEHRERANVASMKKRHSVIKPPPCPSIIARMILKKAVTANAKAEAKKIQFEARAQKACKGCGNAVGYVGDGPPRKTCSKACAIGLDSFKEKRRTHKQLRRARIAGVPNERIKPSDVFDRDGWQCKLCDVQTPKHARGTQAGNAPELDHIKPISKGGAHLWANVQCLCRSCNQKKADTWAPDAGGVEVTGVGPIDCLKPNSLETVHHPFLYC